MRLHWIVCAVTCALGVGLLARPAMAAQQSERPREPRAERAHAQSQKAPKKSADAPPPPPPAETEASQAELDQKLAEARAQRDQALAEASQEKDPEKLEQKKREIFAKFAALSAAMRDAQAAKQPAGSGAGDAPKARAGGD